MHPQQKRELVSAKTGAKKHSEGDRTAIKIPSGWGFFKVEKTGTYHLDFAPYIVGNGNKAADPGQYYFERTFWCHYKVGPNGLTYICPSKTAGKPCPICEEANKIYAREDLSKQAKNDMTNNLRAKQRQLFIVKDAKVKDDPWKLWEFSYHNFGELLDSLMNDMDEDADFDRFAHPEKGYTLAISMIEGSTGNNTYKKAGGISFISRKSLGISLDDLAESMPCLDDLLIIPTYDTLKKAFYQLPDDDEEPTPTRQSRLGGVDTPKGNGKHKEDHDEEEGPPKETTPTQTRQVTQAGQGRRSPPVEPDHEEVSIPGWAAVGELVFYKGQECEVKRHSRDGKFLFLETDTGDEYRMIDPAQCKSYQQGVEEKSKKGPPATPAPAYDEDEEEVPTPRKRR